MYKFSYFTETDEEKVLDFMQKNSFAVITGILNNKPVATHVPLEIKKINERLVFTGHIMKATDHYKAFSENENVLVIFSGPQCYVSANWYVTKNVASTWNYIDVQAKGKIRFTDDDGTLKIIRDITQKYESEESEAAFNNLPNDYVERLSKAIIGFNIEVESVENVFKLSQNHDEQTRRQIIAHLKNSNHFNSNEIATEMEKRIK
ncbi:MAG: FMN-binding negative transcriptional regulator [Ginsengibacter sp.]